MLTPSLNGSYVVEANEAEKGSMWAIIYYSQYDTMNGSKQFSVISKPLNIVIADSPIRLDSFWTGVLTTILGAIIGFVLPEVTRTLISQRSDRMGRKRSIADIKTRLTSELATNLEKVNRGDNVETMFRMSIGKKLLTAIRKFWLKIKNNQRTSIDCMHNFQVTMI